MRARHSFLFTAPLAVLSLSCSSGPKAPEPGTPAFFWGAAKQMFSAGDYVKANENLDHVLKGSNEFQASARPWALVLASGLARGHMEMADAFENGARAAKTRSGEFRKRAIDERRYAKQLTLQFAERYQDFLKAGKDDPIKLAFPFPSGSPNLPTIIAKVGGGMLPQQSEIDDGATAVTQRAVLLETANAAGAPEDTSKGQQMFKAGEAMVARADFLLAMAEALHNQAQLFGPKKLDEPDKLRMLCEQALDTLKAVPETKRSKDLAANIQKTLKTNRRPT